MRQLFEGLLHGRGDLGHVLADVCRFNGVADVFLIDREIFQQIIDKHPACHVLHGLTRPGKTHGVQPVQQQRVDGQLLIPNGSQDSGPLLYMRTGAPDPFEFFAHFDHFQAWGQ